MLRGVPTCRYLIDGQVLPWSGATYNVYSPIRRQGSGDPILIGKAPLQTGAEALAAVQSAAKVLPRCLIESNVAQT